MIRHIGQFEGSEPSAPRDRLARRGRLFFLIACAVMALMAATAALEILLLLFRVGERAGMLHGGFSFVVTKDDPVGLPAGFIPISQYRIWQSTLAAGLLALRLIPGLVLLFSLIGLFRLHARHLIFTSSNEVLMRRIAWALMAYAIVPLITHAALYVAGMSPVLIKLELRQLDAAVLGILLFAFVNVVAFGSEIERDRDGFF
jgi:hypothetical protein